MYFYRIRNKRKLIMMESREKRRVEKPQVPRSAKRVSSKQMQGELEDLGIEMDEKEQVLQFWIFFVCVF